jgi:hypothetical protein
MGRSERFKPGDPPSRKVRLCQVNGPKPLVSDVPGADLNTMGARSPSRLDRPARQQPQSSPADYPRQGARCRCDASDGHAYRWQKIPRSTMRQPDLDRRALSYVAPQH